MSTRNWIAFSLILLSLLCLYPGLVQDILSIKISAQLPLVGELSLYESQQSILQTIQTLDENNNRLVAFLILLFSIIVPIVKALILLMVLMTKELKHRIKWFNFVRIIGKWSMADVFVVGIFLAFLTTRSNDSIEAEIHSGFYYFLAYCIISLVGIQVMEVEKGV